VTTCQKNGRINVCKYLTRKLSGQISDYELMPGYQKICRLTFAVLDQISEWVSESMSEKEQIKCYIDYLSGSMSECMSEDV
jgi:hypothetical protein